MYSKILIATNLLNSIFCKKEEVSSTSSDSCSEESSIANKENTKKNSNSKEIKFTEVSEFDPKTLKYQNVLKQSIKDNIATFSANTDLLKISRVKTFGWGPTVTKVNKKQSNSKSSSLTSAEDKEEKKESKKENMKDKMKGKQESESKKGKQESESKKGKKESETSQSGSSSESSESSQSGAKGKTYKVVGTEYEDIPELIVKPSDYESRAEVFDELVRCNGNLSLFNTDVVVDKDLNKEITKILSSDKSTKDKQKKILDKIKFKKFDLNLESLTRTQNILIEFELITKDFKKIKAQSKTFALSSDGKQYTIKKSGSLSVDGDSHWYSSWWFISLMALAVVILVVGLVYGYSTYSE